MIKKRPYKKFCTQNIDEKQAINDWGTLITEATGVEDPTKLDWMSSMLEIKQRNESRIEQMKRRSVNESGYGGATPATLGGEGGVSFPTDPADGTSWFSNDYVDGSGDIPSPKLGIAMRVAANTPGLELLPVIPQEFSSVIFTFLDSVFATNKINDVDNAPLYFTFSADNITGGDVRVSSTFTKGTSYIIGGYDNTSGATAPLVGVGVEMTFIKSGRFAGEIIGKLQRFVTLAADGSMVEASSVSLGDVVTAGYASYAVYSKTNDTTFVVTPVAEIGENPTSGPVSAIDENIPEAANRDGITASPMSRADGEQGTTNTITLKRFSRAVEAKKYEILAETTEDDDFDLATMGIDANAQLYAAAENLISQAICKDILEKIFRLGVTAASKLYAAQGVNLNLYIAPATSASKALTDFTYDEFVDMTGSDKAAMFGNITNAEQNSSAENLMTRQRKISSRMLAAKTLISNVGRHGMGDTAVLNTHLGTALLDNKNFTPCATENSLSDQSNSLYYLGDLRGLKVYVDPNMNWYDMRISVFRKGDEQSPGLKFMPYDLASSISVISETSMSKKTKVKSRYSLVPAGFLPESQYFTFMVNSGFGDGDWV